MSDRETLLALADCVEFLCVIAGQGIFTDDGDTPTTSSELAMLQLAEAMGTEDWDTCAATLRARAAECAP